MPKAKVEHGIDLQCNLCPKQPVFSDVSHLLTHISSKSHLAHQFKLQIRAHSEPDCKETLEAFHFWYRQNGLDALLSERLAAKDGKKSKKSRSSNAYIASNPPPKKAAKTKAKIEPAKEEVVLARTPVFRAPVPRMHQWSAGGSSTRRVTRLTPAVDWEPSAMYATPTARRSVPNYGQGETPAKHGADKNLETPWKPDPEDDEDGGRKEPDEKPTDSAKLKGILWPGMDLFDSATPEMKRMRNQRKDRSVLDDMMATSKGIEPAEVSYHPNGDFRGSRDIFGPLSTDGSPVAEIPSPKKRKTRKTVLADISVNAPRIRATRGKKAEIAAAPAYSPQKRLTQQQEVRPSVYLQPPPTLNPLVAYNSRFIPTAEEDAEFKLNFGDMGKKRGFSVFNDAPEISPGMDQIWCLYELALTAEGRTETPLEDARFEFSAHHGLPTYPNNSMATNNTLVSPTPIPRPVPFRVAGKESGQTDVPPHQQHNRRSLSDPNVYPYQNIFDGPFNPLFSHSYSRSYYGGGQFNYNNNGQFPHAYSNLLNDFQQQNPMVAHGSDQSMGSNTNGGSAGGLHFGV